MRGRLMGDGAGKVAGEGVNAGERGGRGGEGERRTESETGEGRGRRSVEPAGEGGG